MLGDAISHDGGAGGVGARRTSGNSGKDCKGNSHPLTRGREGHVGVFRSYTRGHRHFFTGAFSSGRDGRELCGEGDA